MPPEIIAAITMFAVSVIGIAAKLASWIADSKVQQAKNKEDQAVKDRDALRQKDLEAVRQTTLRLQSELENAKAENEKNQAVNETLTNLVSATMTLVQTHAAESFANREAITNLAESQGTYGESMERVATAVNENTAVNRATGKKADDVIKAVDRLYNRFELLFPTDKPAVEQIRDGLIEIVNKVCEQKKHDSQEIEVVKPSPPSESEAAA